MIANCVDEKDVLTLNSTCRALSSLVQPVMASTFSSDRTFDFSDEGMAALPALSERTSSAPYLKTLIIVHNGTTKPIGCRQVLAIALKNFGAFGKLTSLAFGTVDTKATSNITNLAHMSASGAFWRTY